MPTDDEDDHRGLKDLTALGAGGLATAVLMGVAVKGAKTSAVSQAVEPTAGRSLGAHADDTTIVPGDSVSQIRPTAQRDVEHVTPPAEKNAEHVTPPAQKDVEHTTPPAEKDVENAKPPPKTSGKQTLHPSFIAAARGNAKQLKRLRNRVMSM